MGDGGAVPGIVLHPKVPDLAYIRTDVGGAYRWEATTQSWIPLLESIPFDEWNLYGVDSIAIDPSDATGNTVYISTGKYTASWAKPTGMLMKSTDRGRTWTRLPLSPTGGSNSDQNVGERLAVDPLNGNHVVYASRNGGLFSSLDAGATWSHVDAAPSGDKPGATDQGQRGSVLAFVLFDASSGILGTPPRTKTMYLGVTSDAVYQSKDGGISWQKMVGSPMDQHRAAIGSDGSVVVSSDGLFRYNGDKWTDITPPRKSPSDGCCAVAIDPADPARIIANTGSGHQTPIFLSTDSGKTWLSVFGERDPTRSWWPEWHWLSSTFSLAFDPHHKNEVWATDWYGTYRTRDITASPPIWTNEVNGIEEIVTIGALLSPREGKYRLFSGAADIGGLDHDSLTTPPGDGIWKKGVPVGLARTGITLNADDPNFVVTVGTKNWSSPGTGAYSLDGGDSWKAFKNVPVAGIKGGRVVVAGRHRRIVWVPQEQEPYFSDDLGDSWKPVQCSESLAASAHGKDIFSFDQPLAVDEADPNRVYLLHEDKLFLSTDAGATFTCTVSNLPNDYKHKIATSGKANDVWLSAGDKGLYRSSDAGASFSPIATVQVADLFCFGRAPVGKSFPALFLKGRVDQQDGYFRSDDEGRTWAEIDTAAQRIGDDPNTMTGDWKVFGGVFIGTNGRGIYYGCPSPGQ